MNQLSLVPKIDFLHEGREDPLIAAVRSPNFLENMQALFHPNETLARKQMEEVIKATADLKTDNLLSQFQGVSTGMIQDFQKLNQGLYLNKKSGDRTQLDANDLLQLNNEHRKVADNLSGMAQASVDYHDTIKKIETLKAKGNILQSEYDLFNKTLQDGFDKFNQTKDPRDIPIASHIATNLIHERLNPAEQRAADTAQRTEHNNNWAELRKQENDVMIGLNKDDYSKPTVPAIMQSINAQYPTDEAKTDRVTHLKSLNLIPQDATIDDGLKSWATRLAAQGQKRAPVQGPTTVINQGTPEQGGGTTYKPLPEYQNPRNYTINGKDQKAILGAYDDQTGDVEVIPQVKTIKTAAQTKLNTLQYGLEKYKDDEKKKKLLQSQIDAIKNSTDSYTITYDYDHPEKHHIDDVAGARNAYTKKTNKGGQKINIPPKNSGKIKVW